MPVTHTPIYVRLIIPVHLVLPVYIDELLRNVYITLYIKHSCFTTKWFLLYIKDSITYINFIYILHFFLAHAPGI